SSTTPSGPASPPRSGPPPRAPGCGAKSSAVTCRAARADRRSTLRPRRRSDSAAGVAPDRQVRRTRAPGHRHRLRTAARGEPTGNTRLRRSVQLAYAPSVPPGIDTTGHIDDHQYMSRVQLALNVDDLDAAVDFYSKLFGTAPAKVRLGYANF